jgi:hypothetical protein
MSSLLSFTMPSSKKEKHYANSRARRHSEVVISQSKKSKRDKDTDTESVSSSTNSSTDTVVVPPSPERKCPLRFLLAGMMETEVEAEGKKSGGCPLRRVQLWHVIPLCFLAIVNLLLVIIALLGLAGYRITMCLEGIIASILKPELDCNPYAGSVASTDNETIIAQKS